MRQAILCVDDEAIIALALKQELRQHFKDRFIYEIANSASAALDVIAELTKDEVSLIVVISDWLMPGMKGDEFLSLVKGLHPQVKTLLITGQAPTGVAEKLCRDGVTEAVILKPWKGPQLISLVETCIARYGAPGA